MKRPLSIADLKLSADVLRLNPSLAQKPQGSTKAVAETPKAKRLPVNEHISDESRLDRCNKTEYRYFADVLSRESHDLVIIQPPRLLELAGGGTYTPDFLTLRDGKITAHETKGGYRGAGADQGYERFKRAATQYYPKINFILATFDRKHNSWRREEWK